MRRLFLYALAAAAALATSMSAQAQGPGLITEGTLTMPTQGQGATFTFSAAEGQYIAVTLREQNSNVSSLRFRIVDPNFTPVYNQVFTAPGGGVPGAIGCAIPGGTSGCWGNMVAHLGPISAFAAGDYTVIVTPLVGTGEVGFAATTAIMASGVVINGGPTTRSTIYPGQNVNMSVSLSAGQNYTLTISETNGYSPGNTVKILQPNGSLVGSFVQVATCPSPCGSLGQYSGSGSLGFTAPVNGTYNFLLQQLTQTTGPNIYGPIWNTSTFTLTSP